MNQRTDTAVSGAPLARTDVVSGVTGTSSVPEAIRALGAMASPDYVDLFSIRTHRAKDRSPEQWARAMLEDAAPGARTFWRLLGLRLGPPQSPDHVHGWWIADRGDDWMRLETASWLMTAHAVIRVDAGQVSLALFVTYDRPMAAIIWTPVSIYHRRAVPGLLRHAVRALDRDGG